MKKEEPKDVVLGYKTSIVAQMLDLKEVKEEPKQECECTDECLGYLTKECKRIEELKQEALEEYEAAIIKFPEYDQFLERIGFEEGAKWQQERSYSEKEAGELVYNIIGKYAKQYGIMVDGAKLNDLFEQFKKK